MGTLENFISISMSLTWWVFLMRLVVIMAYVIFDISTHCVIFGRSAQLSEPVFSKCLVHDVTKSLMAKGTLDQCSKFKVHIRSILMKWNIKTLLIRFRLHVETDPQETTSCLPLVIAERERERATSVAQDHFKPSLGSCLPKSHSKSQSHRRAQS